MILIINMNSGKNPTGYDEFVSPIKSAVERTEDCVVKKFTDVNENDLEKCSKIIMSGTALNDNEFLDNEETFSWLLKFDKPLLGICAGMEIIAKVFNGKLEKNQEIGITKITKLSDNALITEDIEAYELHNYSVTVPDGFESVAKSDKCVQAIRRKNTYGVIFHPEVRNKEILERFAAL